MSAKKAKLGRNPLDEPLPSLVRDTRKEPSRTASVGAKDRTRATFIMKRDHLEALRDLSYMERTSITAQLSEAIDLLIKKKGKALEDVKKVKAASGRG